MLPRTEAPKPASELPRNQRSRKPARPRCCGTGALAIGLGLWAGQRPSEADVRRASTARLEPGWKDPGLGQNVLVHPTLLGRGINKRPEPCQRTPARLVSVTPLLFLVPPQSSSRSPAS